MSAAGGSRAAPRRQALVLLLVALVVAVRKTDALRNPQFWAEDGWVFFLGQYTDGARALLEPYAGYLHLVPRLVALVADLCFPLAALPAVYAWTSLGILLVVARHAFARRVELPFPALAALAIVLVPHHTNEVFLNLTNLQWILALWLVLLLVQRDPDAGAERAGPALAADAAILVACGLSGPFVLVLLPLFAWRWLRARSAHRLALLALAAALAAVQGAFLLRSAAPAPAPAPGALDAPSVAALLGQKAFGNLYLGTRLPYELPAGLGCALLAGTWALLLGATRGAARARVGLFLAAAAATLAAALFKFRSRPDLLLSPAAGVRYFYPFGVLGSWALLELLAMPERWKKAVALLLLLVVLGSSLVSGFRSEPLADLDWAGHARRIGVEPGLRVPVHPEGRFLEIPD